MKWELSLLGFTSFTGVTNALLIAIPGSTMANIFYAAWNLGVSAWIWKKFLPKKRRLRALWRKEHFENWLYEQDYPAVQEGEPWDEIERAISELFKEGIEPTYERAKDWLRRDRLPICVKCPSKVEGVRGDTCGICLAAERAERDLVNPFSRSSWGLERSRPSFEVRMEDSHFYEQLFRARQSGLLTQSEALEAIESYNDKR